MRSLHLKFGINLILTVLEENPDIATDDFADEIRTMIIDAVTLEETYNAELLPRGIVGLNTDYVNTYVRYIADRRLEELGFPAHYRAPNPARWMAAANDPPTQVNFFEATNTAYEVNANVTATATEHQPA